MNYLLEQIDRHNDFNLGGIFAVGRLMAFLLLCAYVTARMERPKTNEPKWGKKRGDITHDGYATWINSMPVWTKTDEEGFEAMRTNYPPRPAPLHEHCIDFERSRMTTYEPSGVILAQCCVAGCPMVVKLGRGIATLMVQDRETEGVGHGG